jgi:hypothetical protein
MRAETAQKLVTEDSILCPETLTKKPFKNSYRGSFVMDCLREEVMARVP